MPELGRRIGLIGDAHGNLRFLLRAIAALADERADSVVQLGDFGLVWANDARRIAEEGAAIARLDTALALEGLGLHVIRGNHENHARLDALARADGSIRLAPRVCVLPWSGREGSVGWLAGAASVDRGFRTEGRDWWAHEIPDDAEAAGLRGPGLRIVLAHEAIDTPALRRALGSGGHWYRADIEYADAARSRFTDLVLGAIDDEGLVVSGHHHRRLSAALAAARPDGSPVTVRSEILPHEWSAGSVQILDADSGQLRPVALPGDDEVRARARELVRAGRAALRERLCASAADVRRILAGVIPVSRSLVERVTR